MVTLRIRSEYMKKFKDPKWETYAKCYEELLKYRLTRRLLEQSHNPWFWGEWGSDTESSGRSTPLCRNKVEPLRVKDHTSPRSPKEPSEPPVPVAAEETTAAKQEAEIPVSSPVVDGLATEGAEPTQPEGEEETRREVSPMVAPETDPGTQTKPKSKPRLSQKTPPPRPGPSTAKDAGKDARHPFALFGAGERDTEMASRKTHNVCPAASTKEIHESALRAKTRREVEKQMKRNDKRRAKSAELEKMKKTKTGPDYDPWMTEYMRCFSARSR